MSQKILGLLLVVSGVAGCTWSHPYKNQQEFYADKMECQQYAQGQTPQQQTITPVQSAQMTKQQMSAAYGNQMGASIGNSLVQGGYFRDCMRSKGYQ
jgi:uncharacterized lipoprotein